MNWYQKDSAAVLLELDVTLASGLSETEAAARLARYGRNELTTTGIKSPWLILWEQLTALMVVILIVAAIISAFLGDYKDAIAIGAIVVLNAILGFSQEYRAEKAMAALKKLAAPSARVLRGGQVRDIPASGLVPGDVVLLEAGNFIAADCRVIESSELQTQESALTGESEPVRKTDAAIAEPELPLGDRLNMAFMGTFVTAGRGRGAVTATAMRTEIGRIATLIQTVDRDPTPLQRRLDHLGKGLAAVALSLVAVIFALGWMRGENHRVLFLTAVSIAVAAVPEGLPAVVTIALTLGAKRMLERRVLIRKLPAVETLGSITVICADKTGTLTQNRMTATVLQLPDEKLDLTPPGALNSRPSGFALLLAGGALCNDVILPVNPDGVNAEAPLGDPTEAALAVAAAGCGLAKHELEQMLPRVREIPFSSQRKLMTTIHKGPSGPGSLPFDVGAGSGLVVFTKGAVDNLLEICSTVWVSGVAEPLDRSWRQRLTNENETLAKAGMRVLGVAFRRIGNQADAATIESDLTFIGMIGIIDPPRLEAAAAVETCKTAGIRPVMITGDHPLTAQCVARQLGIDSDGIHLTGQELERMTMTDLEPRVESTSVYSRVSPEHKLKIVEALKRRGHVVAMTGDGVNDSPALKRADIGVAMGITGTDVAKHASQMVLLDDNFASLVAAVEEGRTIYDNIRKFIRYILATNSGEIWLMLVAPMIGMPLPLQPLQILWMNLVTDGLPALALGVEPPESGTMRRPPYRTDESIFSRGLGRHVIWVGVLIGMLSIVPGYWYWQAGDSHWQTLVFTIVTLSQMAHVMAIRSEHRSLFQIGLFSNQPLLGAVSLTVVLQVALIYVPFLQSLFKTEPLPPSVLLLAVALSSIVFAAVEAEKWLWRRGNRER